jgi:hypothetical protein
MGRMGGKGRIGGMVAAAAILSVAGCSESRSASSRTAQVDKLFVEWNRTDSPGCAVGMK